MNDPFLSSAKSLVRARESLIKRRGAPSGRLFSGLIVSAIGLITTGFAQAQTDLPPVAFDFEAPAFTPGSIDGQRGWVVDQGRAEVVAGKGFQGSAGLVLRPLQPFSQARVSLEGKRRPALVCFVDLQVLPIASEVLEKAELLDVNSARIGLFRSGGSDSASVWVFDGDGVGGGAWLETRMKVPVDAATGRSVTWHRLTVREDIQRQSWDLWLDGSWLAAGLGFQEARPPEAATCILMGDRKEPVFLDDLSIAAVNPLTDDQDADGLGDLLEKQLGFDPARDDRDEDADGDGVANLDQAVQSAATLKQAPLTAARHVMAAPQWSIPPGILNKPAKLMMTAMDAESSIYYTMDGSDPRAEGAGRQMFSGVFDLSSTMVIKAAAVSATGRWSAVVSGAWIFPDQVMDQQRPEGWPLTFEDTARD